MSKASLLSTFTGILSAVVLTTHMAAAGGFGAPAGTVGVTEQTFAQLKTAQCTMDYCDPLVTRLDGKVIMRVEHGGALYRVMNEPEGSRIRKYIPNGIYGEMKKGVATGKMFYVNNGLKFRLHDGSMWNEVQYIVRQLPQMTTGITQATLTQLQEHKDCSVTGSATIDEACVQAAVALDDLRTRLMGTILVNVEDHGKLYYVAPHAYQNVYALGPTVDFNEAEATTVSLEGFIEYAPTLLSKHDLKNLITQ